MALFPDPETIIYQEPWQQDQKLCRPSPLGGSIQLIKYDRYTSNRLREYGPFDRIIDRSKLVTDLTLDDVFGPDRFILVLKTAIMGVDVPFRPDFAGVVFPDQGMDCLAPVQPDDPAT